MLDRELIAIWKVGKGMRTVASVDLLSELSLGVVNAAAYHDFNSSVVQGSGSLQKRAVEE